MKKRLGKKGTFDARNRFHPIQRHHLKSYWGKFCFIALLCLITLAWSPFSMYVVNTDHDALAMLGQIRATSTYLGWSNGYYVNSLLTGMFNMILNRLHFTHNDLLLAYKLVILCSLLGIGSLTYFLLHELTGNPFLSLASAVLMIILPGIISLLAQFEDNIISSFLHLQYVYSYIRVITMHQTHPSNDGWRRIYGHVLFPLSFLVAILGHRQLGVVIVTPLFLYFFLPKLSPTQRWWLIGKTYFVTGLLFSLCYAYLTAMWDAQFTVQGWLYNMRDWFVPNDFYKVFYFFNKFGWDVTRQVGEIAIGILQIFSFELPHGRWLIILYGAVMFFILYRIDKNVLMRSSYTKVLLLFLAIHIPHSLIYESANIERWDVIIPLLVLLIGMMCHMFLTQSLKEDRKFRMLSYYFFGLAVGVMALYNAWTYAYYTMRLTEMHDQQEVKGLIQKLNVNVRAGEKNIIKKILILNQTEFSKFFMIAEVYYSYRDSIFALLPDGTIYASKHMYLTPKRVSPAELRARIQDAHLVMGQQEEILLKKVIRFDENR